MKQLLFFGSAILLGLDAACAAFGPIDRVKPVADSQVIGAFADPGEDASGVPSAVGRLYFNPILLVDFVDEGDIFILTGGVDWADLALPDFINGSHRETGGEGVVTHVSEDAVDRAVDRESKISYVPEPSSLVLGLASLLAFSRWRRRWV